MKRSWVEISLPRLRRNLDLIRSRLPSRSEVIAVVKANAYGHGVDRLAPELFESGIRSFGVADLGEARQLRSRVPGAEILVFGGCLPGEEDAFRDLALTAGLFQSDRVPSGVPVHVKVETGMGRLGVAPGELESLLQRLGSQAKAIYSTLSCADVDSEFTRRQIQRFLDATGAVNLPRHLSNSAGLGFSTAAELEAVRPGLALYGICNTPALSELEPLLSWKTRIMAAYSYPEGKPLGYGASFYTRRPSRIGVIPVGYADGYRRGLSNRGQVETEEGMAPVVGRVSMDTTLIDLTDLPGVQVDSPVCLLSDQPDSPISAAALARELDTIPYEILTSIGPRVSRTYQD